MNFNYIYGMICAILSFLTFKETVNINPLFGVAIFGVMIFCSFLVMFKKELDDVIQNYLKLDDEKNNNKTM